MKKLLSLILILVLATGILTACSAKTEAPTETTDAEETPVVVEEVANPAKDRERSDETLVVGMTEAKGELLPTYYSTTYDGYLVDLMFDPLLTNDEEGNLIPRVAASYELSNENKTYTFKLRDDVRFSDGTPLTAADVAFTFTSISDPTYDGRYNSAVIELEGYEAYNKGDAATVSGINVIDEHTIAFTFVTAKVDNANQFIMDIIPEHIYGFEKGNADFMKQKMNDSVFVGSGRYTFVTFEPKQFVELTANPDWFGGEVKIKNIITKFTTPDNMFQELLAGNTDMQIQVPANNDNEAQLEEMGFMTINAYPANSYGYMGFNLRDPRLSDQRVRQALTYGFNREAFVGLYYNGNASVSNTPISQVSWAYTDEINDYAYDMDKAASLLDEAGWALNADGVREKDGQTLSFVWDTYTDSRYVETMIPMLKADWGKIGVEIEPNLMDFNSLVTKVYTERDFDMYNMAWSLDTDPGSNYSTFHSKFDIVDGNNAVGLRDDAIDVLLEKGAVEFNQEERVKIYQEFAVAMNEKLPYMFLTQNTQWDPSNTRVKNLRISPYANWTYFIEDVELVN
ncbi:MAG: ABC transporter substrate-binding protein [Acidaminobacteraceae bacterium]